MQRKWLYLRDGQTHGPFSVTEMKELAAQGRIAPQDRIWLEGADVKTAILAVQAIPFQRDSGASLPAAAASPPETPPGRGKAPSAKKKKKRPSHPGVKKAPSSTSSPGPPPLEAIPVLEAVPVMEAIPLMEAVPIQGGRRQETPSDVLAGGLARAIQAVQEPNLSVAELYRRAHFALSQWADQEENVGLILEGDTEAILMRPEVLEILQPFQTVPFEVLERLMESLDHLVENRSRYYRAMAERRK